MAKNPQNFAENHQGRAIKAAAIRLSDEPSLNTTDYADIIVGDGVPSGAYGRDASATMLYLRKDASTSQEALYVTGDGGTSWSQAGGEQVVEVTIDNADVRTLNATPVEVIPAPGAGLAVIVEDVQWWLDYGSAAFDGNASGEDLVLRYTDSSGSVVVDAVDESGFADATGDQLRLVKGVSVTPVENAAVVAHILSGEWYSAAGDSDLKARIRIRVVSTTW